MDDALLLGVGERQHGHHQRTSRQSQTSSDCVLVAGWVECEHGAALASGPRGHVAAPLAAIPAVVAWEGERRLTTEGTKPSPNGRSYSKLPIQYPSQQLGDVHTLKKLSHYWLPYHK